MLRGVGRKGAAVIAGQSAGLRAGPLIAAGALIETQEPVAPDAGEELRSNAVNRTPSNRTRPSSVADSWPEPGLTVAATSPVVEPNLRSGRLIRDRFLGRGVHFFGRDEWDGGQANNA